MLVAECCCQQTQAARAVAAYERLTTRFATPRHCADASRAEVLEAFAGLGYYRRAVALHRCAQAIVEHHAGSVPDGLDALLALPGIGPYTARAVLAFAFDRDVGIVDTNVARVLGRSPVDRCDAPRHSGWPMPWSRAGEGGRTTRRCSTSARSTAGPCPAARAARSRRCAPGDDVATTGWTRRSARPA